MRKSQLTDEEKNYLIGKPITRIIDEWFSGQKIEVLESFFRHYEMVNNQVREYNGIYEVLTELKGRGATLGIVSSKYKNMLSRNCTKQSSILFLMLL